MINGRMTGCGVRIIMVSAAVQMSSAVVSLTYAFGFSISEEMPPRVGMTSIRINPC